MTTVTSDPLDSLYGRLNYEKVGMPRPSALKNGLGRMNQLLALLGDPHRGLKFIHVAGTKGKGSTSTLIASALKGPSSRVGLYTSPHLRHLRERYQINGAPLEENQVAALWETVRPAVDHLDAVLPHGPTFFEITTAMAFIAFANAAADPVVLEVGLGGRLDSTNVIDPLVSVITSISYDHTRILGTTLGAIAFEKAGIIKPNRPVISGVRGEEAAAVIAERAIEENARLYRLDRDFSVRYRPPTLPLLRPDAGRIDVRTWSRDWGTIPLPLLGPHQADNAAVALATLDLLAELGYPVTPEQIRTRWSGLRFAARMEICGASPALVVDGAHNIASAQAAAATLATNFPPGPRTLIFGTSKDKDLEGQLKVLLPCADHVIATQFLGNPRAVAPEDVAAAMTAVSNDPTFRSAGDAASRSPVIAVANDPAEALNLARRLTPENGLILVTGSLFLAGEIRELLAKPGVCLNNVRQ